MRRERIDFDTFQKNFIQQPDGFFPVYSCFAEDHDGENYRLLQLDMICEWRLDDGKVRFVEVPFDTDEQYKQLIEYLRVTAKLLYLAITERIVSLKEIKFADLKPESEAVPAPPSGLPSLSDDELDAIRKQSSQYQMGLIGDALRRKAQEQQNSLVEVFGK